MASKRKLESKSTESAEPPKKLQHQEREEQEEEKEIEQEEVAEEEEEEEEEDEEEEDDDDDEEEDGKNENVDNQTEKDVSTSDGVAAFSGDGDGDDDDEEEPIEKLLEPFGKEQVIILLREAADKHSDVADRIRKLADEEPAHRKIFVHGLGWDTNAETLTSVFKEYGEIEDCKAVCDKISGKSKGYGFILFKSRSGARRALKQPQKKIGNRMTACQLASIGPVPAGASGTGPVMGGGGGPAAAPVAPAVPQSEYTLRKIYVSNVGADLEPQKLYAFFSKFGEIEEGPLGLDKMTGKPKGFCLFVYKTVESSRKALEEPHKEFEGHILHCQKAIDGPKPGKSQHPRQRQHSHQFQRNDNPGGFVVGAAGPGHLMAPPGGSGMGFNQAAAAAQALNPALGQALTALLATQGAGLGLTNLLGTLGTGAGVNPGVPPGVGHGMQGGYPNQTGISPGVMGGYGTQGGMQGGYPNQQMGQGGGSGRGQHGGVAPYMGGH